MVAPQTTGAAVMIAAKVDEVAVEVQEASVGVLLAPVDRILVVEPGVLELAVVDGLIGRNPATGVKVPTARTREQRFLAAEQVVMLADAADMRRPGVGLIIETLAYVGLRFGELVASRRSSIDILRRRLTVSASATEIGGTLVFGTPETHETRTVVMPARFAEGLAVHLVQVEPDGLVFTSPQGGPLRGSNFRVRVWRPAVLAAGLDRDLTPHDLRHTAASLMIASGANIKAVQRQLGQPRPR